MQKRFTKVGFRRPISNISQSQGNVVNRKTTEKSPFTSHERRIKGALTMLHARHGHDVAPVLSHVPVPAQPCQPYKEKKIPSRLPTCNHGGPNTYTVRSNYNLQALPVGTHIVQTVDVGMRLDGVPLTRPVCLRGRGDGRSPVTTKMGTSSTRSVFRCHGI